MHILGWKAAILELNPEVVEFYFRSELKLRKVVVISTYCINSTWDNC